MNDRLATPSNAAEEAEANYGDHVIWRLVNSTIVAFGANEKGEIFLSTRKDDKVAEFIIGIDERGDIALFEVEKQNVPVPPEASDRNWHEDYAQGPEGSGIYQNRCIACEQMFLGYKRRRICRVCAKVGGGE